jgi:hypothetical protein
MPCSRSRLRIRSISRGAGGPVAAAVGGRLILPASLVLVHQVRNGRDAPTGSADPVARHRREHRISSLTVESNDHVQAGTEA